MTLSVDLTRRRLIIDQFSHHSWDCPDMPPASSGPAISPLRAVNHLLATTSSELLPNSISHLISAVQSSCETISAPGGQISRKDTSEASVALHRYKTQLSTLLQGRNAEGRWVAVVLIKTTVEVGGWEILRTCDAWVRGLVGILGVCLGCFSSVPVHYSRT